MSPCYLGFVMGGRAWGKGWQRWSYRAQSSNTVGRLDVSRYVPAGPGVSRWFFWPRGIGKVLAQVPEGELPEFHRHLAALGYPWWDETANPAYRMFLAG